MSTLSQKRAAVALGIVVILAAACQASSASPSPSASMAPTSSIALPTGPAPTPSITPTVAPTPVAAVSPTAAASSPPTAGATPSATAGRPSPAPGGSWVTAGTLASDWPPGRAASLGDGGALAIQDDGTAVERWDPTGATWGPAAGLNAPRSNFVAVTLDDGRVLVTGGVNDSAQAYSSTYIYDPATPKGTWTKVGLLGTARSAPAGAVLHDGRVLVAGGAYLDKPALHDDAAPAVALAGYHPEPVGGDVLDDVAPSRVVPALATAETYDPATATWSPTGSMRYARAGASAVTLADGRVLVVSPGGDLWVGSDTGVTMDPRAPTTTEVYDPATGRFALVGSLPEIDRAAIAASGVDLPTSDPWVTSVGTLVALPDGGALLVGHGDSWKHQADVTRSFRFDAGTGRWTAVGPAHASTNDMTVGGWHETPGVDLAGSFAAALPNGLVLVAGGSTSDGAGGWKATREARTYDPVTSAWAALPPMPEGRQYGETVVLPDGSVLLVGGNDSSSGTVTATRFVPSP